MRLRSFTLDDVDALHALWTSADVRKFLWDNEKIPREQTLEIVKKSMALREDEGTGLWAVTDKEGNELIGFGGYWYFFEPPELQILYGLSPEHWGMGLATELAKAFISYGFETLRLEEVVGSTDKPNISSQRVMEKAGMQYRRRERKKGAHTNLDTVYYSITVSEFQSIR